MLSHPDIFNRVFAIEKCQPCLSSPTQPSSVFARMNGSNPAAQPSMPPGTADASPSYSLATLGVHGDDACNSSTDVAPALHVSTTFRYTSDPDALVPVSDSAVCTCLCVVLYSHVLYSTSHIPCPTSQSQPSHVPRPISQISALPSPSFLNNLPPSRIERQFMDEESFLMCSFMIKPLCHGTHESLPTCVI